MMEMSGGFQQALVEVGVVINRMKYSSVGRKISLLKDDEIKKG